LAFVSWETTMNDRSVEIILTEWRAAELALAVDDSDPPSQEVADRAGTASSRIRRGHRGASEHRGRAGEFANHLGARARLTALSSRAVDRILAEWRELERQQGHAAEADAQDAIRARINEVRRAYREVTKAADDLAAEKGPPEQLVSGLREVVG
jgi:hypothetical protein